MAPRASKTENRYKLKIPFEKLADVDIPPYGQAMSKLSGVVQKCGQETSLFMTMEGNYAVTTEGIPVSRLIIDVFDRPVYVLDELSGDRVWLQAPLCTGVDTDDLALTLKSLAGHANGLIHFAVPEGTLVASYTTTYDAFVAAAPQVLPIFCNKARQSARNAYEYLQRRQRKKARDATT